MPNHSISIQPQKGDARFHQAQFETLDYFTVGNALSRSGPAPLDATAGVDIQWAANGEHQHVENTGQGFSGMYYNAEGSIQWSAANSAGYWFNTANSSDVHVAHAFTAEVATGAFYDRS